DSDGGVEAVGHGRRAVVRADVLGLAGTAIDELPLLPREHELVVDSIEVRCLERDDARVEWAAGEAPQDGVGHDSSVSASAYARRGPKHGRAEGVAARPASAQDATATAGGTVQEMRMPASCASSGRSTAPCRSAAWIMIAAHASASAT